MRTFFAALLIAVASPVLAGPPAGMSSESLAEQLALDENQAVAVEEIMNAQRERMDAARELPRSERRAEMKKIRDDVTEQMDDVLNEEQMKTFEELRKEMRKNMRKNYSGRGQDGRDTA